MQAKQEKIKFTGLSSAALHIIAMLFMLLDHMWATVAGTSTWMTCVGRIAFPIFAFMIVEGYFHTGSYKKYMQRLLVFALVSEIPFNLMYAGNLINPLHQNVMWTFMIALFGIWLIEKIKKKTEIKCQECDGGKKALWIFTEIVAVFFIVILTTIMGFITIVDYYGFGIMTVYVFYFFRKKQWWCYLGQLVGLYYINTELLGGLCYNVTLFGHQFEIVQQGFAILSLIPIWLYFGRQGYHRKWFKYFCYAFYPVHMLILALIALM